LKKFLFQTEFVIILQIYYKLAIIGCTRSWNSGNNGQFLVIADNMMNLELLFEGWKHSGNNTLYEMALSHTNKTIKEHIRSDYSQYHVVSFNETDGKVIRKYTAQGYADWSCWAQSQAWLIAGLTIAYRYTNASHILKAAEGVSNYFIDHSPPDGIPFWDFDVPHDENHKYIPRDSSAATIAASGLLELHKFTKNIKYRNAANSIMESLFSDKYRANAKSDYKIPALIVNGTAYYKGHNYDTALIFGDYYFAKSISYYL